VPTYYLIVHRGIDQRPTSAKLTEDPVQTRKYLDKVARDAGKFDMEIKSRSDSGITFADGKEVTVTVVQ
jgi:hypothetical protein